jgi:ribosomal protein S18 acetylase RimI-like enzyme
VADLPEAAAPDGHPPLHVRFARDDEHDAVGELTVAAYREDRLLTGDDGYVPVLADAARRAVFADLVVAADPETDALLGTVTFCLSGTAYAELAQEGEAEFRMLAVSPQARRRGVGEALVRGCVSRARALGATRLVLSTLPSMHAAHALYERLGFVRDPARDWQVGDVVLIAYVLAL